MKRIRISALIIFFLLALGTTACEKDKPTTGGGGGDNSATISGTVNVDGVTLTIYDGSLDGRILWGPTVIGKSYSAKFGVSGKTNVWMKFSKSGCNDGVMSIDVVPGTNITIGDALLCV